MQPNKLIDNRALATRLLAAQQMIVSAEKIILSYYQNNFKVDIKQDLTPVTAADKGAERIIRDEINKYFPDDGIIGEEFGTTPTKSGYIWTIDPIDGTIPFIHGVPLFSTLIGLIYHDEIVMGLMHFPALKQTVYATQHAGAYWKKSNSDEYQHCQTQPVSNLEEVTFCHSGQNYFRTANRLDLFNQLQTKTKYTRSWGDAFSHMLVATGQAHLAIDPDFMKLWDVVPLKIIVEEAGGYFCPLESRDSIYKLNSALSASSKEIAEKALQLI